MMLYVKNVPIWERAIRIGVSIAAVVYGIKSGNWLVAGMAAGFSLTGLFGFCPMCALVGRKINK